MSAEKAEELGVAPLARVARWRSSRWTRSRSSSSGRSSPCPRRSTRPASLEEVGVGEVHEAFAAPVLPS